MITHFRHDIRVNIIRAVDKLDVERSCRSHNNFGAVVTLASGVQGTVLVFLSDGPFVASLICEGKLEDVIKTRPRDIEHGTNIL